MSRRVVALLVILIASCTGSTAAPVTSTTVAESITGEYRPGVEGTVIFPDRKAGAPVVVMIPGGAWVTADPAGFDGLARYLADSGVIVAPVEVRAAEDGVVYPTPVEDALCAAAFAVDSAMSIGFEPGPVALFGHSSGAHLAALGALGTVPYPDDCPNPEATPDALIGLAGVYDVSLLPDLAEPFFGVAADEDPRLWDEGNPVRRAGLRPDLPVLLVHGDADELVPLSFTTGFASALEEGGHPTTVEVVAGAGHHEVYAADWVGDLIVEWVRGLTGD
jgi:acetyl esterase/lipase